MRKQDEYLNALKTLSKFSAVPWWPKYVYHFTDITNAVEIIKAEKLYARDNPLNHMVNDNASTEIINITKDDFKNFVRFYFRPKTPTQFHNEGYKPRECRKEHYKDADIPVPIFFLFEACEMLALPNAYFSETSLASQQSSLTNDFEEFKTFDFIKIYSDGPYCDKALKLYRHAELVVKAECDLKHLRQILCRSQAEYQTFCYLLKEAGQLKKYKDIIGVKSTNDIFNKRSLFISFVTLLHESAVIHIENTNLLQHGKVMLSINVYIKDQIYHKEIEMKDSFSTLEIVFDSKDIQIALAKSNYQYIFEILFDECLVYKNNYENTDLPF